MIVHYITNLLVIKDQEPNIMAIGFFDGVHLGHQKVIAKALEKAKKNNVLCSVMIFNPHPHEVLGINTRVEKITPLNSKINLFEDLGVDICYLVDFTEHFANINPNEFVNDFLIKLNIKGVVVGYDFTFGKKGTGNSETLKEISNGRFSVDIIDPYILSNSKVSSSRIRACLINGNIVEANILLGRRYSFKGEVIHGDARGKDIGFPTANLKLIEDYLNIKKGVYVVNVKYNENNLLGVMNVGSKPTFAPNNSNITYEIYILNFNKDIYGYILEVELIDYLRKEQKYDNIEELKKQINSDIVRAEKIIVDMI